MPWERMGHIGTEFHLFETVCHDVISYRHRSASTSLHSICSTEKTTRFNNREKDYDVCFKSFDDLFDYRYGPCG